MPKGTAITPRDLLDTAGEPSEANLEEWHGADYDPQPIVTALDAMRAAVLVRFDGEPVAGRLAFPALALFNKRS